jgi:4-diphosphocytidyl-2-C-methyl-D-erythritol kinase
LTKRLVFCIIALDMGDQIRATAPCKINLHLRVLERRTDGYHGIESLFQRVSLADELSIERSGPDGVSEVISPLMGLPPINTVTRAIEEFRRETGVPSGLRVTLTKRVPAGAGLGGGSSDAAAVLRGLDSLFDAGLSQAALACMAARIGSDVPFFLSGPAALVKGRGEIVSPIPARDDLFGVLIWPGVASSTVEAYALVDEWTAQSGAGGTWPRAADLPALYRGPVSGWPFRNSFTAPIASRYPIIGEALAALRESGADFAEMSGSGSAVFGLFSSKKEADAAYNRLSARWQQCVPFLLLAS